MSTTITHIHTDPNVNVKLNQIIHLLGRIMATEQELLTSLNDSQAALSAMQVQLDTVQASLNEASAELSGFPASISELTASIDAQNVIIADLTAQLANQVPGTIPQSVSDAVAALNASLPAVQTSVGNIVTVAANLANIVPNPTV